MEKEGKDMGNKVARLDLVLDLSPIEQTLFERILNLIKGFFNQ